MLASSSSSLKERCGDERRRRVREERGDPLWVNEWPERMNGMTEREVFVRWLVVVGFFLCARWMSWGVDGLTFDYWR